LPWVKEFMSIGINLNNFNSSYGINRIPVVRPEDVAAKEQASKANSQVGQVENSKVQPETSVTYNQASRIANLEDISLTFNKEDSFSSIGSDVDINNLDMTKAISDMKRDSILSDYQTFVGPSAEQMIASLDDGIVFMK